MAVSLLAQRIRKSFENRIVLQDISLSIDPGSFVSLTGGNGAGKTTLLKIFAKLTKPDEGYVELGGKDIWKATDSIRKSLGLLSHQIFMYDDLNAIENLRFSARLFDISDPDERIVQVLKQMHLYHRQYDAVKTYSRGMQQRLALARSILHDPEILLLDEPFSGLDESGVDIFTDYIKEFRTEKKSAILVSHNLRVSYELSDDLYILDRGHIGFHQRKNDVSFSEYHQAYRRILEQER